MAPFFMLLAQLVGKQQQEEEQRQQKLAQIAKQRAAALGGNTMGIEAEEFKRAQGLQNFATAKEMFDIYDSAKSKNPRLKDDRGTHMYGAKPDADKDLLDPYKGIPAYRPRNDDSFVPWQDDPYGLRSAY